MNFPSKPWTDGQTAELIAGSTFRYDASKGAWLLATSSEQNNLNIHIAENDSDFAAVNAHLTTIDGQIAIIQGDIVEIKARLDSDYTLNNEKHAIQEALITAQANLLAGLRQRLDLDSDKLSDYIEATDIKISDLESNADSDVLDIARLRREADSDTIAIQALSVSASSTNSTITEILAMLDSDGVNIQALRTELEAEIAATNADVSAIEDRLDSDSTKLQSLQTQLDALGTGSLTDINNRLDSDSSKLQSIQTQLDAHEVSHDSDIAQNGRTWKQATTPNNPGEFDMWYDTANGILFSWSATLQVWVQVV